MEIGEEGNKKWLLLLRNPFLLRRLRLRLVHLLVLVGFRIRAHDQQVLVAGSRRQRGHRGGGVVQDRVEDEAHSSRSKVLDDVQDPCDELVDEVVNFLLVRQQEGMEQLLVDDAGAQTSFPDGKDEEDEGQSLGFVVERHPEEEDVGDGLDDGEQAEDDPIHQPFDVVDGLLRLEGLEGAVGRVRVVEDEAEHGEKRLRGLGKRNLVSELCLQFVCCLFKLVTSKDIKLRLVFSETAPGQPDISGTTTLTKFNISVTF